MRFRSLIITFAVVGMLAMSWFAGTGSAAVVVADGAVEAPAVPTPPAVEPALEECEQFEGETVLDLVRAHRRGDADVERRELAQAIIDESRAAGIDPLLVASIVASESSFRTHAVSRVGAVGLMQIRPFVARDVAGRVDLAWQGDSTLTTPALNLRLGIGYYRELLVRFDGDEEIALSAYNQGPTRVRRKLSRGTYQASEYAGRILARYGELAGARLADPLQDCSGAV